MEKGKTWNVLDKGYVKFIGSMGDDAEIVEAARMSTGRGFVSWDPYKRCKRCEEVELVRGPPAVPMCAPGYTSPHDWQPFDRGDLGFLEFMYSNRHMTPFEMPELCIEVKAPIFVFREWHRHRTQCLAGDTRLHFDLPGGIERRGTQKTTLTIKQVFEKFQPGATRNQYPIQAMRLRTIDEETLEVGHTTIVDVWESGPKKTYEVEIEGVGAIRTSADHRFFTPGGWKTLKEILQLPKAVGWSYQPKVQEATVYVVVGAPNESVSFEVPASEAEERWRAVVGWETWYEVSNMGRVRRVAGGQGVRTQGTCKKLTPSMAGYLTTNLNRPGVQECVTVHTLVLAAFSGSCPEGMECRHLDGNQMNNWISNLKWGTPQENADDRSRHGRTPGLKTFARKITSVKLIGEEMTYDIEVSGPYHNFVAEGFVVHNSYNEFSARYAQMPNEHYIPALERIVKQSKTNKQASGSEAFSRADAAAFIADMDYEQKLIYGNYDAFIKHGVANEIARINTPVSRYSKMRAKTDLRNWLGFLLLRKQSKQSKPQWEIAQFADVVGEIIQTLFPHTYALFEEHTLYSTTFSRTEMAVLLKLLGKPQASSIEATGLMTPAQIKTFQTKLSE